MKNLKNNNYKAAQRYTTKYRQADKIIKTMQNINEKF